MRELLDLSFIRYLIRGSRADPWVCPYESLGLLIRV
jgi:hypothetical protein